MLKGAGNKNPAQVGRAGQGDLDSPGCRMEILHHEQAIGSGTSALRASERLVRYLNGALGAGNQDARSGQHCKDADVNDEATRPSYSMTASASSWATSISNFEVPGFVVTQLGRELSSYSSCLPGTVLMVSTVASLPCAHFSSGRHQSPIS
jgi:hypothetical protein